MTTQHAIHVHGLKKSFNDLEVLRGVAFFAYVFALATYRRRIP